MSYPPISGYYGSPSGSQNGHREYAMTGEAHNRQNPYQNQVQSIDDGRQNQYGSSAYGWSTQNQNATLVNPQQGYGNEVWQDRSNTASAYPYQRERYASSEQMSSQAQQYNARDTYSSQNTQGLNNLAYASELEPTTTMKNNMRTSHTTPQSTYNTSGPVHTSQIRTASPANNVPNNNQRYVAGATQPSQSNSYSAQNDNSSSSLHNQNMARNAAAALAGAARNMYPNGSQYVNSATTNRASNSPMTGQVHAVAQQTSQKKPATSFNLGPPVDHQRKTSMQSQTSSIDTASHVRPTAVNSGRKSAQPEQHPNSRYSQPKQQNQQPPVQNISQQQPNANPQNIANLVNDTTDEPDQVSESIETQEPMPYYIDPTQVFNPYHREHERKKKEAAEAEARRKAEEKRLAEESRRLAEDTAKKVPEPSATANSKSEITKKASAPVSNPKKQPTSQASASSGAPASNEDDMAAEMQRMVVKMKEYKTSNPAMFQKLWNDMRGGPSATASGTTSTVQSLAPQVHQTSPPTSSEQTTAPPKPRSRKSGRLALGGPPSNGYRVVIDNNLEGLPDLGRFPAERRIRQSYNRNKTDASEEATVLPEQGKEMQGELPAVNAVQDHPMAPSARSMDPAVSWPEPRRQAVAMAAVQYLKSIPENQHVSITVQDVCSLLERNPSYLDLCTALESQRLKFHRSVLARELLKSVPELQTPASKATPATKGMASISSAALARSPSLQAATYLPADVPQPVPQPLQNLYGAAQNGASISQGAPGFAGLGAVKIEQPKPSPQTSMKSSKARPSNSGRSEPPLGTKEAAARKRDFSELIDLTEIDGDENYVLPTKQPRLNEELVSDPFKSSDANGRTGFSTFEPLRFNPQVHHSPPPQPQAIRPPPPPMSYPRPFVSQPKPDAVRNHGPPNGSGKTRPLLANRMNYTESLQKSYYDPKTVARDILIASGRHPSERPLNLHLAGLLGGFIDLECDLSTFDWDTVDPGGPPLPKVEYVDILVGTPRFKLGERATRRKRAKLTEIEKTRGPEKERRGSHSASRSLDPSHLPPPTQLPRDSESGVGQDLPHRKHSVRDVNTIDRPTKLTPTSRNISVNIPVNSQHSIRSASHKSNKSQSHMDDTPNTKRRGRPPGSKNKHPSVASMKQQAKTVAVPIVAKPDEAPEPLLHSYKCKWVKCHAELHNLDTLRRHVGIKHTPTASEVQRDGFVCWWKKCQFLEPDGEGNIAPTRTFPNYDEWLKHVDEDHIEPIAQKYGDGPQAKNTGKQNPSGLDLSKFLYNPQVGPLARTVSYLDPQSVESARLRYLADREGRATTPLVTQDGNSDRPPDAMVLTRSYPQGPKSDKEKADVTSQNAFMKAHGNRHKDTRKAAEEVVRAMEVRKQKIGPGLDRGGCTLINEARRNTFIQAPGISRIVDADY